MSFTPLPTAAKWLKRTAYLGHFAAWSEMLDALAVKRPPTGKPYHRVIVPQSSGKGSWNVVLDGRPSRKKFKAA